MNCNVVNIEGGKMTKCIRCGNDILTAAKICPSCLSDWSDMRTQVFTVLEGKYGKLSPTNHQMFIKETKRLESIWRKDKQRFALELNKLEN